MEKVKIEIDMPNCCGECPCGHYDEMQSWCGLRDYYDRENSVDGFSVEGKPEWCPLLANIKKHLPEPPKEDDG